MNGSLHDNDDQGINYFAQAYPTAVRSVAMGMGSSMGRLGAMITPYVAQVRTFGTTRVVDIKARLHRVFSFASPIEPMQDENTFYIGLCRKTQMVSFDANRP